jgi:hypothetical protein
MLAPWVASEDPLYSEYDPLPSSIKKNGIMGIFGARRMIPTDDIALSGEQEAKRSMIWRKGPLIDSNKEKGNLFHRDIFIEDRSISDLSSEKGTVSAAFFTIHCTITGFPPFGIRGRRI